MVSINTYIDVELDDIWDEYTAKEKRQFITDAFQYEGSAIVPDGWFQEEKPVKLAVEDDTAYRLQIITWLRENGWTVEPIG